MTDSLIFFLKTEASPLCREVTVSYSITETVEVAVSFPLDDVMPWFPGDPKSAGWNLNSFGLSPQMAGKWMNMYFLLWWLCSTVPVLPYVTWIETAVWYLVIPLVDCAVHCLPHPWVIPNGMSCASKIWSCASSPPFRIPFGCASFLHWPVLTAWLGFSSEPDTFRYPQVGAYLHSTLLKFSLWPMEILSGQSLALREWSSHPEVETPAGIHHLNKGVGAVWWSPGLPPERSSCVGLVSYLPASCGCLGCLDVSFWATECHMPRLVCWIAL